MLSNALCQEGHDVLLISFKRQYPSWLFPGESDRDPSECSFAAQNAHYWIDSLNPLTWLTAFRRIRRYRPNCIVLQWWTPFWTPVWLTFGLLNWLFLRAPLTYICHNVLPHEAGWLDPFLAWLVLRWGDAFIVQSEDERAALRSLIPKARIAVVPHPVYDMFADQRVSKQVAREKLGLPQEAHILLFFGIVREYKGLRDLLRAMPLVKERLEDVLLIIAGEFWDGKEDYLEEIYRLGIEDQIIVDDRYIPNETVSTYFSATDVLVAPYRHVTGSGVVQMAWGMGCAVITTRVGNLPEVTPKEAGDLIAHPQDSQSLANVIIRYFTQDRSRLLLYRSVSGDGREGWKQLVSTIEGESFKCTSPYS
jgi:glycosyltransferase involved in cell wall biosynthesis